MPTPFDLPGLTLTPEQRLRMAEEIRQVKLKRSNCTGDCGGEVSSIVRKYHALSQRQNQAR